MTAKNEHSLEYEDFCRRWDAWVAEVEGVSCMAACDRLRDFRMKELPDLLAHKRLNYIDLRGIRRRVYATCEKWHRDPLYLGTYEEECLEIVTDVIDPAIRSMEKQGERQAPDESDAKEAQCVPSQAAQETAPCSVCGWIHDGGDMTSFRDPEGKRRYTFRGTSRAYDLLTFIHAGMKKGQPDVDCSTFPSRDDPYEDELREPLRASRKRQPNAHKDLLGLGGNRRARIRHPKESRKEPTEEEARPTDPK